VFLAANAAANTHEHLRHASALLEVDGILFAGKKRRRAVQCKIAAEVIGNPAADARFITRGRKAALQALQGILQPDLEFRRGRRRRLALMLKAPHAVAGSQADIERTIDRAPASNSEKIRDEFSCIAVAYQHLAHVGAEDEALGGIKLQYAAKIKG